MAGEVRVDTREVDRALALVEAAAKDLTAANRAAAEALLPGVKQRTPVRTGALAASWRVEATADAGSIVSDERYAGIVENGDAARGIEGAHMGAETVDASERELGEAYEAALAVAFKRAGFDVK